MYVDPPVEATTFLLIPMLLSSPRCHIVYYCIPYKDSKSKYIGETLENIHKRLYEHRRNINNTLFQQIFKSDPNFDFNATTMLAYIYRKRLRRIFVAGAITLCPSIQQ